MGGKGVWAGLAILLLVGCSDERDVTDTFYEPPPSRSDPAPQRDDVPIDASADLAGIALALAGAESERSAQSKPAKPPVPKPVVVAKAAPASVPEAPPAIKPLALAEPAPVRSVTQLVVAPEPPSEPAANQREDEYPEFTVATAESLNKSLYSTYETGRFRKLGRTGGLLDDETEYWACVRDKATGLLWESKTLGKMRNGAYRYLPTGTTNECGGNDCSLNGYVSYVNRIALCGHSDWRVPSKVELLKLVHFEHNPDQPSIDIRFFPNTQKARYWTRDHFQYGKGRMIIVDFESGYDKSHPENEPAHLRLVAGQQ